MNIECIICRWMGTYYLWCEGDIVWFAVCNGCWSAVEIPLELSCIATVCTLAAVL